MKVTEIEGSSGSRGRFAPGRKARRLFEVMRQEGVRATADVLAKRLVRLPLLAREDRRWDQVHGVSTEGHMGLDDLTVIGRNKARGFASVASPVRVVRAMLNALRVDFGSVTFVDFGSGKGRALLIASEFGFRSIIGVEFSPELARIATSNVAAFSSSDQRCRDIQIVCGDAADFEIPATDCVLYFNNPFSEPVMRAVLDNIQRSHSEHAQTIYILYQQLRHESDRTDNLSLLRATGFLRLSRPRLRSLADRLLLGSHRMVIYEPLDGAT